MLRIEYIETYGYYRIYNVNEPNRTIAYESDYEEAKERVKSYNERRWWILKCLSQNKKKATNLIS